MGLTYLQHRSRGALAVPLGAGGGGGEASLPEGLALALTTVEVGDLPATLAGLANNTDVGDWPDGSGENNDAFNPELLNNRPRFRDDLAYGFPVVSFDRDGGLSDYLRTPLVISSGGLTIILGYARNIQDGESRRLISGSNNWFIGPWGGRYRYHAGGTWVVNGASGTEPVTTLGNMVVHTGMQSGAAGSASHYLDGVEIGSGITPAGHPGTINLGAYGAFQEACAADVAVVLIWDRLLDTEEREAAEALVAAAIA